MTRQIDIKAIISHILCGDGLDKCRICMGSTQEGQVFLGDTVMKDGGKSVTLGEILLSITGLQMHFNEDVCPNGVCAACTNLAISAFQFRILVRHSQNAWSNCFNSINFIDGEHCPQSTYLIFNDNLTLQSIKHFNGDMKSYVKHFINKPKIYHEKPEKKERISRNGPNCVCSDCGKEFHSPYYLNLHLKNSSLKEACWLCARMFARGGEMKSHLLHVHKIEMIVCNDCPLLFKNEADAKAHIRKCHSGNAYTCIDCGSTFSKRASLGYHSQMHAVRTCRLCDAQFANRGCYRYHRSKCEPNAKPNLKTLPRNKRSNVRDPARFICDYCKKVYPTRPQLQNHIIWIHMDKRPHQCQWCGKRFYTSARLSEHSVVHTRERKFACDICGMKLVSKMAVVYHRRRHTGEKPYECEDCGERFLSSSRRSDHVKRKHGKGLKLECSFCKTAFVRNHDLQKHIKKMHWLDESDMKSDAKIQS
ncbi:unnamed protein product [Pieris macdunnoughi]|uniref:Uncharacterized protein n=1 Tax=Pieris macdunnoughi TaxID=345717 RepID=A0A821UMX6_9NEOP|nr:unnamed protein product [Pieris macdunnoughi]